jgi:hypothetical protein
MNTYHVYGSYTEDGDTELIGSVLGENIYEAVQKVDDQFRDYFIDEVSLAPAAHEGVMQ